MSETAMQAPVASHARHRLGQPSQTGHATERKSLLLRSAKVVCLSGEYVCLVRDVSETGTTLKFLHAIPPEPRIILMLANGLTYPIERVREEGEEAAYRFAAPIAPDEFIHEDTPFALRPIRLAIRASARVIDGRHSHAAQLLDLSSEGAKIECTGMLKPQRIISIQLSGAAQQLAQVAWCDEAAEPARYGLHWRQPLGLAGLAAAALRMQPFGAAMEASAERAA